MKCPTRACREPMVRHQDGAFHCPDCQAIVRLYQFVGGDQLTPVELDRQPAPVSTSDASVPATAHVGGRKGDRKRDPERDAQIIAMHVGDADSSIKKIAVAFDLTLERIRQILDAAGVARPRRRRRCAEVGG